MNARIKLEPEPATFDEADLGALRESIVSVLSEMSGSLAVHAFIDGRNQLDTVLWRQAAELGWLAVALPEQYGGLGLGARGLDVLHQELGRHLAPGAFIATLSAAHAIAETASDAVKNEWLPRIATGEISVAVPTHLGDTMPSGKMTLLGSPDAAVALIPYGDNWVLADLATLAVEQAVFWDQTRCVLEFDVAGVTPVAELPGATGAKLADAMALAIASDSIGAAQAITDQTVEYMKNRQQFGRPIASFQALKHRAADLVTLIATNTEVVAQAVAMAADREPDAGAWAALAKAQAADAFVFIAADCIQLHGGVGFTWEFDAHIFLKRARFNEMLIAPNPQMRDRAAAGLAAAAIAGRTTLELATS